MNGDFFIQCGEVLLCTWRICAGTKCLVAARLHVLARRVEWPRGVKPWKGEHCWCDACTLGREKGQSNMPEEGESLRTTALSPYGVISARLGRGE